MHTGYELVWLAAERTPDNLAIVDDQSKRRLTYRQMIFEIEAVAAGLSEAGVGPGTRVAVVLPSNFECCILVLALMRLNAVPAMLNYRLKSEELTSLCVESEVEAAVILPDEGLIKFLLSELPVGVPIWSIQDSVIGAKPFSECRAEIRKLKSYEKPDEQDIAFLFFTSGTTGLPKAVVLNHRTTEHRLLWLSTQAGLRHGIHNRSLGCMPISHAIGFYGVFLVSLAFNGTYFVVSEFDPNKIIKIIEREQLTFVFCVPTMFQAMIDCSNYHPTKFSSLQLILYGGLSIDPVLLKRIDDEWGGVVRHIYGTTETMCSLYNPDPVGQHATLRPGYYSRVRLIKVGGESPNDLVEVGGEGELIVDANIDTIFSEYFRRPKATAEKLQNGWYHTGDIFQKEVNGDYTLVGRVDDMIRSGGESIHPEEVEKTIAQHSAVLDVSVIGIVDPKWGQMVTACVICRFSKKLSDLVFEFDDFLKASSLAPFKRPKAYLFLDELPRNAANKVSRHALRDKASKARTKGETDFYSVE